MKNFLACVAVVVCLIWAFGICGSIQNHYTRNARCVEITDTTILFDDGDEIWAVHNNGENIHVGDNVKMRMFTNGTDNTIYDDEVESWKIA